MKSIFITTIIVGAVLGTLIYYATETQRTPASRADDALDDIEDAAGDAYDTMNKHIGRVERTAEKALDGNL